MRYRILGALLLSLLVPGQLAYAARACTTPLTYSIASIDSRFNVSQPQLVEVLAQAESVWESPSGRNLFAYATSGGAVRITLTYDSRQADTDRQKAMLVKLDLISASFDSLSVQHTRIASSTEADQASLATDFNAYKGDEDAFNADIAASNARGGATPTEYTTFAARSAALKVRFDALKSRETMLNERIARLNTLAGLLDSLVKGVNGYIARYNAALSTVREYEEGRYQQNDASRSIIIYQFNDMTLLTRALAHEFGHALGMDHVSDPQAIMYMNNRGTALTTTASDMTALKAACEM